MTSGGRARGPMLLGLLALLGAGVAWVVVSHTGTHPHGSVERPTPAPATTAPATPAPAPRRVPPGHVPPARAPARAVTSVTAPSTSTRAGAKFFASWGSGLDQVGHTRPEEGDPMGPMSLAVDAKGRVYILDEINDRIVRRGADGRPETTIHLDQRTPEDIAIARDGSIAVLDRHGDRDVALYDASGAEHGKLPLVGPGIADPGEVTSIFIDGNDVYAERDHATLVKLGDTSGNTAASRSTLAGRPSRDGTALLSAVIVNARAGRVRVTSIERASGKVRFARDLALVPVVHQILLLDTDRTGTVYFAVEVQRHGEVPAVMLSCLDPATGAVIGGAVLPANTLPEESFRDFAVLDDGGVVYALRSDQGVTYQHYNCR